MHAIDKHQRSVAVGRDILVGKDIIELLSGAMYVEPLTFYREYIQNGTDSIDEARNQNLLKSGEGKIEITVSPETRTIKIRDNGMGIPSNSFVRRLTAFGGSQKRGSGARGFRGVGRLSGLGYCQTLTMRSKYKGDGTLSVMVWDCVKLKEELRTKDNGETLGEILEKAVTYEHIPAKTISDHFFEVELSGVVRVKGDSLLSPIAIYDYLSQVGPVPFAEDFKFASQINDFLEKHATGHSYAIHINESPTPVTRPLSNDFDIFKGATDCFSELEFLEFPGLHDSISAVGWVLHHSYKGALPANLRFKGLRLRNGNLQIGKEAICEELFPEPRFNSWTVAEVHVIDGKIIPNGRRDAFEHNAHYNNLVSHLTLTAKLISKRCRQMSADRAKSEAVKSVNQQSKLLDLLPPRKKTIAETMEKRKAQKLFAVLTALSKCGFHHDDVRTLSGPVVTQLSKL